MGRFFRITGWRIVLFVKFCVILSSEDSEIRKMSHLIYGYSLCVALSLMLFFGTYFILARTPDKAIFGNYLRSRRIMGAALLLLAANYSVHFFFEIRFVHINAAILMNLSTYLLCYWLFSSALTTLLDRFYLTRRRFVSHICQWLLFTVLSGVVLLWLPEGPGQKTGLIVMAAWLIVYGILLASRLIVAYRRAVRIFDDTYSDNIAAYIRWLSIFTYWAVIFGVGCGLLTFLPDKYIYVWILSSVPFYIYLFCSYMNYLLFYEQVECALESEMAEPESSSEEVALPVDISGYGDMPKKLAAWIDAHGYVQPGLTIRDLAELFHTNRTYLSSYINSTYRVPFRVWVTGLRLEYAKRLLSEFSERTIAEISEASGFLSLSYFTKVFTEKEGCSPARWRRLDSDAR